MARSSAIRVAKSSWSRRQSEPQSTPPRSTYARQYLLSTVGSDKVTIYCCGIRRLCSPSPVPVVVVITVEYRHAGGLTPSEECQTSGSYCAHRDGLSDSTSVRLSRSASVASRPCRESPGLGRRLSAALGANWSGARAESRCLSPFSEERVLLVEQDLRSVAVVVEIATGIDGPVYSGGEEPAGADLFRIEVDHIQYLVGGAAKGD